MHDAVAAAETQPGGQPAQRRGIGGKANWTTKPGSARNMPGMNIALQISIHSQAAPAETIGNATTSSQASG